MTKTPHYPQVEPNPDFAALEETVLAYWQESKAFEKSVEMRPARQDGKSNAYVFYDGPPFANGLPHYGHLLTGYVKDSIARYHTMKGSRVERRFGWDCHGLPAEMGAEKELQLSGRAQIMEFGIGKFNEHCRTSVMKYVEDWRYYVSRQGRWVDFDRDYKTMDKNFMESVLWAFKQLYDKGLVYESMRVMPYSWAAETPLSNFETKLDNSYRDRDDKAATVAFKLKEVPKFISENWPEVTTCKILAWTTTPWTLPSNLALAVNKDLLYTATRSSESECRITLTQAALQYAGPSWPPSGFVNEGARAPLGAVSFQGSKLIGLSYEPLFPYFKGVSDNAFKIYAADFVTEGDGTGVVHIAPGFGEDDFKLGEANDIGIVVPVDGRGFYTSEVGDLAGLHVIWDEPSSHKNTGNEAVLRKLKEQGALLKQEQYRHSYPHCWRTDTPLIYRAMSSWYVEVTKFRDRAVELNQQINWVPEHIRDGQMGHMLATAPDWSISRNRFWGTPIPVWRSTNPQSKEPIKVFGSIKELEEFFGPHLSNLSNKQYGVVHAPKVTAGTRIIGPEDTSVSDFKIVDLHRPSIDDLRAPDPSGGEYRRVEDVFDCWFESGSMPFAQLHYPFENKQLFEENFPADFITEYVGQTRGWFNTLIMLSTALFDKPPFKNCICHGVVLDSETGHKYSKRLKNYKDPKEVMDTFGADALRWLMLSSPVMRGMDLSVDPEGKFIRDVVRLNIKPIWNAYNFFTLYANADGITAKAITKSENMLDRYILAKCKAAVMQVEASLDAYDTPGATEAITGFFEVLNNWYIRRSRPRFWAELVDADKQAAYDTLFTVLNIMVKAAAPLLPFATEAVYRGLNNARDSVHWQDFPDVSKLADETDLVSDMDRVRDICNVALSLRGQNNLRVRLPLRDIKVVTNSDIAHEWKEKYGSEIAEIIKDEINVKEVGEGSMYVDDYANLKLKINSAVLGKRLPQKMKEILPASKKGEWKYFSGKGVEIAGERLKEGEYEMLLEPKPGYENRVQVLSNGEGLVVLNTEIDSALEAEGLARDLVRMIQQARKDAGLDVSDRIDLALQIPPSFKPAMAHADYIKEQTLAVSIHEGAKKSDRDITSELDGEKFVIGISKAA